jgi:hypothetical protein
LGQIIRFLEQQYSATPDLSLQRTRAQVAFEMKLTDQSLPAQGLKGPDTNGMALKVKN